MSRMAKAKKKTARRSTSKTRPFPVASLAPQILEEAAQGWLQSSGAPVPPSRTVRPASDHRLAEALHETLQRFREEIAELRSRLERLESR